MNHKGEEPVQCFEHVSNTLPICPQPMASTSHIAQSLGGLPKRVHKDFLNQDDWELPDLAEGFEAVVVPIAAPVKQAAVDEEDVVAYTTLSEVSTVTAAVIVAGVNSEHISVPHLMWDCLIDDFSPGATGPSF